MRCDTRHPNHRPAASLPPELRRTKVPSEVRAWVAQATGAEVVRWFRLPGASSAAVHRLLLADGSAVVLRRYVWRGFLEAEPDAPAREVDALRYAARHGLAVPSVIEADLRGEVPAILMSFVPGRPVATPPPEALTEVAAAIHAVDADRFGHEYFPWYSDTTTAPPPLSSKPQLWERAMELWHTAMPAYRPVFIHRDFHPGNVLWRRGALTGIVDWAASCRGPVGCDIAHCRENLIRLAGLDAADRFQRAYERLTGIDHHPFWELASVLEHGPSSWTLEQLAISEPRLQRAVAALT